MAHGPDTDELLKRIAEMVNGELDVSCLNIISLQVVLTPGLKDLNCSSTKIQELPELPEGLEFLDVSYCPIKKLPRLPESLIDLDISDSGVEKFTNLPANVFSIYSRGARVPELALDCDYYNGEFYDETMSDYVDRLRKYIEKGHSEDEEVEEKVLTTEVYEPPDPEIYVDNYILDLAIRLSEKN